MENMEMCYVCVYLDYLENLETYTLEEQGRLFRAMLTYAKTGEEPEFSGREQHAWPFIRSRINRDLERIEISRVNGRKGGRPKKTAPEPVLSAPVPEVLPEEPLPAEEPEDIPGKPEETQENPEEPNETIKNKNKKKKKNKNKKEYILSDSDRSASDRIVAYLNDQAGTGYRPTTPATQRLIRTRMGEGFTEGDFRRVIENQCKLWRGTDMSRYLRPETLFGTKFEGYLNGGGTEHGNSSVDLQPDSRTWNVGHYI